MTILVPAAAKQRGVLFGNPLGASNIVQTRQETNFDSKCPTDNLFNSVRYNKGFSCQKIVFFLNPTLTFLGAIGP